MNTLFALKNEASKPEQRLDTLNSKNPGLFRDSRTVCQSITRVECGEAGGEAPVRIGPFAFAVVVAGAVLTSCGYHVAGRSEGLPKSIHVIAVTALENKTTIYRIEQRLTAATVHEFLAKTPYRVVSDPANGDAVLRGKVLRLEAVPLLFETKSNRATSMLVTVKCEVTFEDRETGRVLYHTDNFLFRNEYEISTDVKSFFEEQDPALDRLAQDFAAQLVAAVIENF